MHMKMVKHKVYEVHIGLIQYPFLVWLKMQPTSALIKFFRDSLTGWVKLSLTCPWWRAGAQSWGCCEGSASQSSSHPKSERKGQKYHSNSFTWISPCIAAMTMSSTWFHPSIPTMTTECASYIIYVLKLNVHPHARDEGPEIYFDWSRTE